MPSSVKQLKAQMAEARAPPDGEVLLIWGLRRIRAPMLMTNRIMAQLIERTVEEARRDMPQLKRIVTLSPMPWFAGWSGLASDIERLAPSARQARLLWLAGQTRRATGPADPTGRI